MTRSRIASDVIGRAIEPVWPVRDESSIGRARRLLPARWR